MALKYYRSNNSDWNTDANWSTSSGGGADTTFPTAGDEAAFDANSGNCTLDLAAACDKLWMGYGASAYAGKLDGATLNVTIGTGGLDCTDGGSAELDLGTGTWTCSGDWDDEDIGTKTPDASTVIMAGASKAITTKSSKPFYDLTINDDTQIHADTSIACVVNNTLLIAVGKVLTVNDSLTLSGVPTINGTLSMSAGKTATVSAAITLPATGSITGDGRINISEVAVDNSAGGTWDIATSYLRRNSTINAGTYGGAWTFENDSGSINKTLTIGGALVFNGASVTFDADTAKIYTVDNSGNHNLTFQGAVTLSETGGGTLTWTAGSGTITLSGGNNQNINFLGKTIEDFVINKPAAGDVVLTGALSPKSFTGTACVA